MFMKNGRFLSIYKTRNIEILFIMNKIKPSSPTCPSCDRNHRRSLLDQDESRSRLWQAFEKRQPHETCNHGTVYLHTPGISHCKTCDNFLNILALARMTSHQTSTSKESYAQLLYLILRTILEQPGSL